MVYLLENVDLTVDYLLSIVKDLDNDVPLYNSCFYSKHTEELLSTGRIEQFEPITGIYDEGGLFTADFDMQRKKEPIKLKELRNISEHKKEYRIERDIDDGYVYDFYENIVYYKGAIVLC